MHRTSYQVRDGTEEPAVGGHAEGETEQPEQGQGTVGSLLGGSWNEEKVSKYLSNWYVSSKVIIMMSLRHCWWYYSSILISKIVL